MLSKPLLTENVTVSTILKFVCLFIYKAVIRSFTTVQAAVTENTSTPSQCDWLHTRRCNYYFVTRS